MADDRKRLVVEPAYAASLGIALFAFAMLEFEATWCCEQMHPGSLEELEERTAGRVADTLVRLVKTLPPSPDGDRLRSASARFQELVRVRNSLFHSRPMSIDDTNVLSRNGDEWTIDEINNAADQFVRCGEALNASLHSYLGPLSKQDAPDQGSTLAASGQHGSSE
jgi:hypothetical protein